MRINYENNIDLGLFYYFIVSLVRIVIMCDWHNYETATFRVILYSNFFDWTQNSLQWDVSASYDNGKFTHIGSSHQIWLKNTKFLDFMELVVGYFLNIRESFRIDWSFVQIWNCAWNNKFQSKTWAMNLYEGHFEC